MMARGSGPARCRRGVVAVVALLIVSGATFAARAAELSVPDHGVGSDVVDRELHGRDTRFQEGTKVWFWTRVVGATEGDLIRHVWMQGGEERLNVELKVDGSPWRTYSHKTLHAGSRGSWTVEARDEQGRVLARETFECAAPDAPGTEGG
jgi:hypothetical protein